MAITVHSKSDDEYDDDTPSRAADFYLGRGADAAYLGTVALGAPDDIDAWTVFTAADPEEKLYDDADYVAAVGAITAALGGRSRHHGWTHPYADSSFTAYSYSFDKGAVYIDREGFLAAVIYSNQSRKSSVFPTMLRKPHKS